MPKRGDTNSVFQRWNGSSWVSEKEYTEGGSGKSTDQIKGELGYKAGSKPAAAPQGGLAGYAAAHRVKTMEEQAKAVEGAKPTPTPSPSPKPKKKS